MWDTKRSWWALVGLFLWIGCSALTWGGCDRGQSIEERVKTQEESFATKEAPSFESFQDSGERFQESFPEMTVEKMVSLEEAPLETNPEAHLAEKTEERQEKDPGPIPEGLQVYRVGASTWIKTPTRAGLVLAGGGKDQEAAFRWMLDRAGGGDIVILRTSGGDGYNNWIKGLGQVNSVTTLLVDTRSKADSAYVQQVLQNAEMVFLAGGDQSDYYKHWNQSKLEQTVLDLAQNKKIPIGGTSAGMASLGGLSYIPADKGVLSKEALADPFHPYTEALRDDFFDGLPFLKDILTETHFYERDRMGRLVVWMARQIKSGRAHRDVKAIAADEGTALCIDEKGMGQVISDGGSVYFLRGYGGVPELVERGKPLEWSNNKEAIEVQRVSHKESFDLSTWQGGARYLLAVEQGALQPEKAY